MIRWLFIWSCLLAMSCMPAMADSMLPQEGKYSATCSNNLRNQPAILTVGKDGRLFSLEYQGRMIASAQFPIKPEISNQVSGLGKAIEQKITIRFPETMDWALRVNGSDQSLAAETRGKAQERFPLIREIGLSRGLSDSFYMDFVGRRVRDLLAANAECAACKYRYRCGGGCRATALLYGSHDLMGCDRIMCLLWKKGYAERIRQAAGEAAAKYGLPQTSPANFPEGK